MLNSLIRVTRRLPGALVATTLLTVTASPLAPSSMAEQISPCQVNADFSAIVSKIGPATVGDCVADELVAPRTGDRFQTTSRGLLILSNAGNWTAFTDGQMTWINGASGLFSTGSAAPAAAPAFTAPMQPPAQPAPGQPTKPAPAQPGASPAA